LDIGYNILFPCLIKYVLLGELPKDVPVMVWIHGGAFIVGNGGPDVYGPDYFMGEKSNLVILVTLNYRLGILGFLSLDDDVISGNMGLKDQSLALEWVKKNIVNFGGNPKQVTIFGDSAGGVSIMAHIVSPWSSGLFHKAIVQSGPFTDNPLLHFSHPPLHYAKEVIQDLNQDTDLDNLNSVQLLELLQNAPLEELVARNAFFEKFMFMRLPWKPIVDKHSSRPFIPRDPTELLSEGSFNKVQTIDWDLWRVL
jgi:carboxylesterase type B